MINRKYYLCSLGVPNEGYDNQNIIECMISSCYFFGKNLSEKQEKGEIEKIKEDDLLLLYYKADIVSYGLATSKLEEKKLEEKFNFYIKIKSWKTGVPVTISNDFDHKKAVVKVDRSFALEKIEEMKLI